MRVVPDSNVLLAGLGTRGLCEAVVSAVLEFHELVLSGPILAEVERHLARKLKMPPEAVAERLAFLRGGGGGGGPRFDSRGRLPR